jgi:hypothetical protein
MNARAYWLDSWCCLLPQPRRDGMFAQEPVHPQPRGPVFPGRQVQPKTAPGVGQQPVLWSQQRRPEGIQMHVITRGAQVAVAAALHNLRLVAPGRPSDKPRRGS